MVSDASGSAIDSANFDDFNANIQAGALKSTRNALALPNDVAYHRSMDADFANGIDKLSTRVLALTNKVLALASADEKAPTAKGKEKLKNEDDVIDNFRSLVVDTMDQLLERTDISLDEFLGRIKPPSIAIIPTNPPPQKKSRLRSHVEPVVQHASYLSKPQLSFKRRADNNDNPWYPSLSHKYNAQVPLGYHFNVEESTSDPVSITNHPYRYEIKHIQYPQRMFQNTPPLPYKEFEDTPFTWISTMDGFQSMLAKLKRAPEIAVDLEHHSYRSYSGFVCLMQISTREEDWIIDTLSLRDELSELNEVFTNPKIVKVFHGADSDIIWLQQDFSIYVVNLFDTYHASRILEFPRHGLANLLEMYCDFTPDKRYQLADWRIRPLPIDMLEYARSDTHFLLYIYDNLCNALIDRAQSRAQSRSQSPSGSQPRTPASAVPSHTLVKQALVQSEGTCLRVYEKEVYDVENGSGTGGWDTLARKWNKASLTAGGPGVGVSVLQRAIYQAVHKWREMVARKEDESTRYVLSNHFLFQLAEQPPADMAALLGVFHHSIPPLIRKHAKDLLDIVRDCTKQHSSSDTSTSGHAIELPVSKPDLVAEDSTQQLATSDNTLVPNLWKLTPTSTSVAASSSSLLSTNSSTALHKTPQTSAPYVASRSALFGNLTSGPRSKSSSTDDLRTSPHFRDVVTRINSNLVIAPSVPKITDKRDESTPDAHVTEQIVTSEFSGMQVEIPFIPASRRKVVQVVEDSIVTVGQARPKKRKRVKTTPSDEAAPVSAERLVQPQNDVVGSKHEPDEHEPFDFSAVPNILDDNPNSEDTKRQKRTKKQKSGGMFYGDFPAPPKAHSEFKRGNQSHTFKS